MKKVIAIMLALLLVFSFVACSSKDSAKKVKADYEAYDWDKATETAAKEKAQSLLDRIKKLSASEQQELSEIKTKLDKIVAGSNVSPSPSVSPTPTPTPTPTPSPSGSTRMKK